MDHCEHVRELLLESLYGLLEPAEEELVLPHLEQCALCQAALAAAERQRGLLARAAQVEAHVPLFSAPSDSPATSVPEPQIVSLPPPAPVPAVPTTPIARGRWRRRAGMMAAAAALLLAIGAMWKYHHGAVAERAADLAAASRAVSDIDARLAEARREYQREQDLLPRQIEKRFVRLEVLGPATLHADSPASLRLATRDLSDKPTPARVTVRVMAGDKEIKRQELASDGLSPLTLPAGLFQKTGAGRLLVEASAGTAMARVEEAIKLESPEHLAHLALNKSIYQVGEVVFFRALVLQSFNLKLPERALPVQVSLIDAQGKTVKQLALATGAGGVAAGELALTQDLLAGTYVLEVKAKDGTTAMVPQRRQLEVLRDLPPQLQFDRDQYRPGDTMTAQFKGRRGVGGRAIPNQDVNVKILVDGKQIKLEEAGSHGPPSTPIATGIPAPGGAATLRTDAAGNAAFRARLPTTIDTGKATVEIQSRAGKKLDKLVQPIPVVASRLDVDFYPEGGNLVAGVPNRVYYRVRTPLGEPADPDGYVIILSNKDVVLASERNQGQGTFTFIPDVGERYALRVTSLRGVVETAEPFKKLGIRARGVVLHVPDPVSAEGKPLPIVLRNTGDGRRLLVVAACRGRIVAQEFVEARPGTNEVRLAPVAGTRGVVRVTVYDADTPELQPLAERLVFRMPTEKLVLSARTERKSHLAGERVNLRFQVADEKGTAVPAWLLAAVVDERLLGPFDADAAGPAASFYLLSEIHTPRELEHADVLLRDDDRARRDLDFFLGTYGWRRFVAEAPAVVAGGDKTSAAGNMVLLSRASSSQAELYAQYADKLRQELARLRQEQVRKESSLDEEQAGAAERVALAARALADIESRPVELVRLGLGILVLALILTGCIALVVGMLHGLRRGGSASAAWATSCGCLLACLVLYLASRSLPEGPHDGAGRVSLPPRSVLPDGNGQPVLPATTTLARTPQGLLALAPPASPLPLAPTDVGDMGGQRSLRATAKDALARDNTDRNPGLAEPQLSSLMKKRFAELEVLQQLGAGGAYAASKKSKGANAELMSKATEGTSAYYFREYRYDAGPRPTLEGTLLWHPALFAAPGKASVSFDLPAASTSYRILLYGHDAEGRLGQWQSSLPAR